MARRPQHCAAMNWATYWALKEHDWRQYDFMTAMASGVLSTFNVMRSSLASSSYSSDDHRRSLRWNQASYVLVVCTCALTCWILLWRPAVYRFCRRPLAIARWLGVGLIVRWSTTLPIFQAMQFPSCVANMPLFRLLALSFHTGALYCCVAFTFHTMPWMYMAAAGLANAALINSHVSSRHCAGVVAQHGNSSMQPHPDFSILHSLAAMLDIVAGHGSIQAHQQAADPALHGGSIVKAAAWQQVRQLPQWLSTARAIAAACPAAAMQAEPRRSMCTALLEGQCKAVSLTLTLGATYLAVLVVVVLERLSKWWYLQHHHEQHPSEPGGDLHRVERRTASSNGIPSDLCQARSASEVLRVELLKLLVLVDLPLLLLWWACSSWLRPALPAELSAQVLVATDHPLCGL